MLNFFVQCVVQFPFLSLYFLGSLYSFLTWVLFCFVFGVEFSDVVCRELYFRIGFGAQYRDYRHPFGRIEGDIEECGGIVLEFVVYIC